MADEPTLLGARMDRIGLEADSWLGRAADRGGPKSGTRAARCAGTMTSTNAATATTASLRTALRTAPPLAVAVAGLVLTDIVGGLLAVASGLNTRAEAWGSAALLAAPLPMIGAQVLLTWLALRLHSRWAALPAGLLAVACLVSVVSGFFDGGLGHAGIGPGLAAYQLLLLAVTGLVGVLAAARARAVLRG